MLVHNPARIFQENLCEDVEAKFDMVELLLGGQCKKDFMRFKKTVTKGLIAFDSTTSIATPRGIIEDSFKMMLDKFKNQAFKDFTARHQVNFLRENLHKSLEVTDRACVGRLQESSSYLEYYPGYNLTVPLIKGDLMIF